MEKVLKRLGVELPEYILDIDPTKQIPCDLEWTIPVELVNDIDKQYKSKLKSTKKQKPTTLDQSCVKSDKQNIKRVKKDEDCVEVKQE